jgi:uncharacterized membrane protein YbhN (UPF0104 family)
MSDAVVKDEDDTPAIKRRWVQWVVGILSVAFAGYMLYRALGQYSWDGLVASVASIPMDRLMLAAAFAAASYVCLTFFDYLALRYVGRPLPWYRAALTSFTALSLGHSVGLAVLSSGAVRYRFYRRYGLRTSEVAKVIGFCAVTVGLGLIVLLGAALLIRLDLAQQILHLPAWAVIGIALVCLALTGLYLVFAAMRHKPLRFRRWTLDIPTLPVALGQVFIGALNYVFVAACLYQTLSALTEVDYLAVAAVLVIATLAAMVTHAPGGLGVIESVVLFLVPGRNLIGALLAFRFLYFLAPLMLGLVALAAAELAERARQAPQSGEQVPDPA